MHVLGEPQQIAEIDKVLNKKPGEQFKIAPLMNAAKNSIRQTLGLDTDNISPGIPLDGNRIKYPHILTEGYWGKCPNSKLFFPIPKVIGDNFKNFDTSASEQEILITCPICSENHGISRKDVIKVKSGI